MAQISANEKNLIRALVAAFLPDPPPISADRVAARGVLFVSDLGDNGSESIGTIRLLLTALDVSLNFLDLSNRDQVRNRLTALERGGPVTRQLARFAQRLATFLIYATLDESNRPPAALAVGYEIFPDRPRGQTATIPIEPSLPREIWVQPDEPIPDVEFDVLVVGSGSGGSVVVRRLVEDHGLNVALLEIGDYIPESWTLAPPTGRPRPFPWDEMENLLRYYKDGGLQLTQRVPMFVFQGQCLGGSSVVNNAVCFRMPVPIRQAWSRDFGIPWTNGELDVEYERVAQEVGIGLDLDLVEPGFLNPSGCYLRSGAAALHLEEFLKPCDVNLTHDRCCLGCGYCNLVCGYLRKRSVLQTMLPAAWTSAAKGKGKLTVFTGRKAVSIEGATNGECFTPSGVLVRRRKHPYGQGYIRAKQVVVSAGAVASSSLLARSGGVRDIGLPVGRRFSFNFGSPVHAEYEEAVRAFDGLQIAHYYLPDAPQGFVIETWFNPPATQSLALPGWMDDLDANIKRFAHFACAAPLIGSSAGSSIHPRLFTDGEDISVTLNDDDLARLKAGLRTTCDLFFNSTPSPKRVLIGRLDDWELSKDNYVARIESIKRFDDIQIGTGHPQGGNCMAASSGADGGNGVIAPDFRVHGTRGLYVADASAFPTSLGVNPHWTVMAIASLAAKSVAEGA